MASISTTVPFRSTTVCLCTYGFASFLDPNDAVKAFRDKHGKYLGSRPCSITRSTWKDRDFETAGKHGSGGGGKKHKR